MTEESLTVDELLYRIETMKKLNSITGDSKIQVRVFGRVQIPSNTTAALPLSGTTFTANGNLELVI